MKYFVLGSVASGMLLFGASLIYGFCGGTAFVQISRALLEGKGGEIGTVIGLVFVVAGLAFKVSAVPFHMWTPDVYEGAPTPVTALFAVAPKIAAMSLMVSVLMGPFKPLFSAVAADHRRRFGRCRWRSALSRRCASTTSSA